MTVKNPMIALCIECSNTRGMGHLFRALLYADHLRDDQCPFIVLVNSDKTAIQILEEKNIDYVVVDYEDLDSHWENKIIKKYGITCWINDKFDTSFEMGSHIKETNIPFFVIDDVGKGERFADVSFAGMLFPTKKVYLSDHVEKGIEYIILNPEISKYRRERKTLDKILVSLGGSDTYGATVGVVRALVQYGIKADIHIGPEFAFMDDLQKVNKKSFRILQRVPSLIELYNEYDFAITGGGVTCCEAMASGLPCAIIANEDHEINTAMYFEKRGSCVFFGKHDSWDEKKLQKIDGIDLAKMSRTGMDLFPLDAVDRIFNIIENNTRR